MTKYTNCEVCGYLLNSDGVHVTVTRSKLIPRWVKDMHSDQEIIILEDNYAYDNEARDLNNE